MGLMQSAGSGTARGDAGATPSPPPRRGLRLALAGVGAAAVLFGGGFLWFVRALPVAEAAPVHDAEGIVVLTGAAFRISDALELLAAGRGKRLLITGVNPLTRSREISRLVPEYRRWFTCCVDLDHSATNTIGNAIETRRWVRARGFRSLIVVTSNFHMPRAMVELAHQLPDVSLEPFPVVSDKVRVETWWSNPSIAKLLFFEYLKYIVAGARIRLQPVEA
jgi:uncharacterized SAM-binding protein YcdF (DUF218 family)